jgi:GH15 family glucan-1,4-alpha-glucosidase
VDGFLPIADYALIGDGRTTALVGADGTIDWLCLPNMDSASVFGALLDPALSGRFALAPVDPFEVERCYLPGTNVLETTFVTAGGRARVRDALTLPNPSADLPPFRELARSVEGVTGRVRLRWRMEPRFGYGLGRTRFETRRRVPVATSGADALAVCAWDAGRPAWAAEGVGAEFEVEEGASALLALVAARGEPLVFPGRRQVLDRFERTITFWRGWAGERPYEGRWRDVVVRSALFLKLLVFAPSGAVAAAPTTSLPESIGGVRNWDYRFCWVRDAAYTLEALLRLGCRPEAHAFFWWFMHAANLSLPRLKTIYRLDGGAHLPERELPLAGYRGSRPVRAGNRAADQRQLDIYGALLDMAWRYASQGYEIDPETGGELADVADFVAGVWTQPDSGIWEVRSAPRHFTHSKVMCWVALDRAARLAGRGCLPAKHRDRWTAEAAAIRTFVDRECWSDRHQSYVRAAGADEPDAALLVTSIVGYDDPRSPRSNGTIDFVRRRLGRGPFLYRYLGEDGLPGGEGVFLACSFWLVHALARAGRLDEATDLMDRLCACANDVGLFAEEIEPDRGEFLGNFPQGLVHLALVNAALAIEHQEER